jgi:hypothetical protein
MSELLRNAEQIINKAEHDLRELLRLAAQAGDYESLLVLTECARSLKALLEVDMKQVRASNSKRPSVGLDPGDRGGQTASSGTRITANGTGSNRITSGRAGSRAARSRKRQPSRGRDYPKFFRDGESLVKLGWSKSEKAPYEHRAPRRVLSLLVNSLKEVGQQGKRFTTEDVLPLMDPADRVEIPSYQAYLCLAWLRAEQLIVQHGRRGYSLRAVGDLDQLVEERFSVVMPR